MRLELTGLLVLALGAGGCRGPEAGTVSMRHGSLGAFAVEVEPHLEARCAQGGCHGRPDRPLSLYAPGTHRVDPERLYLDEPLTWDEIAENARRLAAFAQRADPEASLALRKPLAMTEGGCWHGGGDVFGAATDPAYRAMRDWLGGWLGSDGGLP